MSYSMMPDEAWATLGQAHTGVLTTLRADGTPVTLPVWFVAHDDAVFVATPAGTRKIGRVRRDPRVSFLVESGERWAELRAVHLDARAEIVDDEILARAVLGELDRKYAPFRTAATEMPSGTALHYASRIVLKLSPVRITSWDNARVERTSAAAQRTMAQD